MHVASTRSTGFTMIELMISIAILAILTALAMPNLTRFLARNELVGTTNVLVSGLNLARTEAITRSTAVAICPSSTGAGCSNDGAWEQGFMVFVDDDNNTAFTAGAGGEELIRAESGYGNPAITISTTGTGNTGFTFTADGILQATGDSSISLNHSSISTGQKIVVKPGGQISSEKT